MEHTLVNHFIAVAIGVIFLLLPAKIKVVLSSIALSLAIVLLIIALGTGVEPLTFIEIVVGLLLICTFSCLDLIKETRKKKIRETATWTNSWHENGKLFWVEVDETESGPLYYKFEQRVVKEEVGFPPLPPLSTPTLGHTLAQELSLTISWLDLENKYEDNDIDQRAL